MTLAKLLQSLKDHCPILVTFSGIVTLAKLLQLEKTLIPRELIPLPSVMLVRLVHPWKAPPPMLVTLSGIVIFSRLLQR